MCALSTGTSAAAPISRAASATMRAAIEEAALRRGEGERHARALLTDIFGDEAHGAVERRLGGGRVIAAALVAIEAVARAIDEDRHVRPRLLHLLDVGHGDALVLVAEVQHGRPLRLLARGGRDAAAVISDRA